MAAVATVVAVCVECGCPSSPGERKCPACGESEVIPVWVDQNTANALVIKEAGK